ncbi:YegS/Rv2252/BmrU family lipid kinase [Lactobacillus sp. 0.1XD8-4]|uniref:Diacylglycerol kinase n=1 Tax=Limosilactobacillus walteri TaxID=2268022 RepID=A0ABR8P4W7_9LACO|nr:YegS/Rv2252/BmrU family lipid kinase [Limosilactobacillus walteri]MBD5805999.1 diacylglycerol kinase [Limosilactobacillus walteri]MRN06352.1 YegS/Rv2252/BmrU family lipid kinase [Lactobacillus sp. 0.1XD8-4]
MNYSIILNRHAGNGNAEKAWSTIKPYLDQQQIDYHFETTKYPNHGEYLAKQIAQSHSAESTVVIAIGGDGTLHQVVNGLMKAAKHLGKTPLAVGYIPAGTGNDFARGYGISLHPHTALNQILTADKPQMINIGHYHEAIRGEDGYFLNNIGIGFDAAIVSRANTFKIRHKKNHIGRFTYLQKALGVMYDQEPFAIMIQCGHERFIFPKAYIAIASNHPFIGGGFRVAPHASLAKPSFELVVAERKNWPMTTWQLLQLARGKLDQSKFAHHFQGDNLHITTTSLEFSQTDGEEMGNRFIDIALDVTQYPIWQTRES